MPIMEENEKNEEETKIDSVLKLKAGKSKPEINIF
jgi:hypothetical protein